MEPQPKGNFLYDAVLPQVELINWLVLGVGLLLRCLLLVRGGNMLLVVSLEGLAIVYFLRAFEPSKQEITMELNLGSPISNSFTSEVFITVLSRQMVAFGSAIILLGTACKIRFWEGAAIMLPVGTGLLLAAIAWQSSVGILTRQTVLIAGLGLFAWALPTATLVKQLFRDDPALVEKLLFLHQHPQDQSATKKATQLIGLWHKRKH